MHLSGTRKETGKIITSTIIKTPLGNMLACAVHDGICLLEFEDRPDLDSQLNSLTRGLDAEIIPGRSETLQLLQQQIEEYFNGNRTKFDMPIHMVGTDFQKKVWNMLLKIPYGKTLSYKKLTQQIGDAKALRAVAGANGANKIAIVIPCHRVVGSDGTMVGYAGGVSRKDRLLHHENRQITMTF